MWLKAHLETKSSVVQRYEKQIQLRLRKAIELLDEDELWFSLTLETLLRTIRLESSRLTVPGARVRVKRLSSTGLGCDLNNFYDYCRNLECFKPATNKFYFYCPPNRQITVSKHKVAKAGLN